MKKFNSSFALALALAAPASAQRVLTRVGTGEGTMPIVAPAGMNALMPTLSLSLLGPGFKTRLKKPGLVPPAAIPTYMPAMARPEVVTAAAPALARSLISIAVPSAEKSPVLTERMAAISFQAQTAISAKDAEKGFQAVRAIYEGKDNGSQGAALADKARARPSEDGILNIGMLMGQTEEYRLGLDIFHQLSDHLRNNFRVEIAQKSGDQAEVDKEKAPVAKYVREKEAELDRLSPHMLESERAEVLGKIQALKVHFAPWLIE